MKFEFHNPTHLVFEAGSLSRLGEVVRPHGKRALLVTGGGSVKRTGTLDRAVTSLKAAGVSVVECAGVEPNGGCRPSCAAPSSLATTIVTSSSRCGVAAQWTRPR